MRKDEVPQDDSFYRQHKRACYAVDESGRYVQAESRGWEVEHLATSQALLHQEEEVEAERQAVVAGKRSPLAYHLATHQLTPRIFAAQVGLATWRVKRHLKPAIFARLSSELLARYAGALAVDPAELATVPDTARHVFLSDAEPDA